jgi:hypothetical protein
MGRFSDAGDEKEQGSIEEIKMETYFYVNIFETKGLEYLLLMAFLVLLVLLFRYFKTPLSKKPK